MAEVEFDYVCSMEMTSPAVFKETASVGTRVPIFRGVRAFNGFVVGGLVDNGVTRKDDLVSDMVPLGERTTGRKNDVLAGFIYHQDPDARRYYVTPVIHGIESDAVELTRFLIVEGASSLPKDRYETRVFLLVDGGSVRPGEVNSISVRMQLFRRYLSNGYMTSQLLRDYEVAARDVYIPETSDFSAPLTEVKWEDRVDYGEEFGTIIEKPPGDAPAPYVYTQYQNDVTGAFSSWDTQSLGALVTADTADNPFLETDMVRDALIKMDVASYGYSEGARYANMVSELIFNARSQGVWRRIAALYNFAAPTSKAALVDIRNPNREAQPEWYVPPVGGDPHPPGTSFHPWAGFITSDDTAANALDLGIKLSDIYPYHKNSGGFMVLYEGDQFYGTLVGCADSTNTTKIGAVNSGGSKQLVYASQVSTVSNTDVNSAKPGLAVVHRLGPDVSTFVGPASPDTYTSFVTAGQIPDANIFVGAQNTVVGGVQTVDDYLTAGVILKAVCFFGEVTLGELDTIVKLVTRIAGNKRRQDEE